MTSFDSIRELSSFRNAKDEMISRKTVGKILEAGRQTPSPGNVQSLEFIVVEDEHKKHMFADASGDERVEHAPTLVIVLADIDRMARRVGDGRAREFSAAEAASAIQNMRLTAWEEDIASCWISGFDEQQVAGQFNIPSGKVPMGAVAFAYTDTPVEKPSRFGMNSVAFYDEYDNQIGSVFDGVEWKGLEENKRIYGKKASGLTHKLRRKLRKFL
ncbi:MAG: nitroreductase family protein [Candidatus Nanohaloarchaea archaeon]